MKKTVFTFLLCLGAIGPAAADSLTPRLSLDLIPDGSTGWGTKYRSTLSAIDSGVAVLNGTNTFTGPNVFSGSTTVTGATIYAGTFTVTGPFYRGAFAYYLRDYYAVGDGSDETTKIQNALNAAGTAGGGYVFADRGRSYLTTTAPVIPTNVIFDMQGSTLAMTLGSGNVPGVRLKNYSWIQNGYISVTSTGTPGSQPFWHACISIGEANDLDPSGTSPYQHVHGWGIQNMVLRTSRDNTPVIQGMGDISNGTIQHVTIPDSSTSNGIFFDSGNVGLSSTQTVQSARMFENQANFNHGIYWTTHPHDIAVRDVLAGNLTTAAGVSDHGSRLVRLSGVYNFTIQNTYISSSTYAAYDVTAGDLGFEFALINDLRAGMQGILFDHVRALGGREAAELDTFADNVYAAVVSSTYSARTATTMQGDITFLAPQFVGLNLNMLGDAIRIEQSDGIHIKGGACSLYLYCVDVDTASTNVSVEGMDIFRNLRAGIYVFPNRNSHDLRFERNFVWGNGTDSSFSTTQAGIDLAGGVRPTVRDNKIGADNEDTQYYGIRLEGGTDTSNGTVTGNNCRGVKSGGACYQMGDSSTAYGVTWVFNDNVVTNSTQTFYTGANIIPVSGSANASASASRTFRAAQAALTGGTTPTAGTWVAGDTIFYLDPSVNGRLGSVCTTGGTPGTWTLFGNVGVTSVAAGGTSTGTALSGSGAVMVEDGSVIKQGPAGTSTQVLHGNAGGTPTYSAASLTADVTGVLPVANGGTNSSAALNNNRIVYSTAGAIVEGPAGTATTVLHGSASALPSYSAVSLSADVTGTLSGSSVSGGTFGAVNGSALTNLNASNLASGTASVSVGGTGVGTLTAHGVPVGEGTSAIVSLPAMANGGLVIGAGTGVDPGTGTLTATSNQTSITNGANSITVGLAGPHNFTTQTSHGLLLGQGTGAVTATPAMANGGLVIGAGTGVDPGTGTITGTANQINVTLGANSIILGTPQNIGTGSSPTFAGLTDSALTSGRFTLGGTSGVLTDSSAFTYSGTSLLMTGSLGVGSAVTSPAHPIEIGTSSSGDGLSLHYTGASAAGNKLGLIFTHNRNSDSTQETLSRIEGVAEDNQSTGGMRMIARNGSDVEVMRLWSTGRVGIGTGTNTPAGTLTVAGSNDQFVVVGSTATGSGTALLGSNSPATTNTAPFTWITMQICTNAGSSCSTVYVPAWK